MMEGKAIKEEVQDKDYGSTPSTADSARRAKPSSNGKDRRSPEFDEARPPSAGAPGNGSTSPPNNGSADSLSPPLAEGTFAAPRPTPALHKLRRFLSTLLQFAADVSLETGDRVRTLIHSLVSGALSVEDFQSSVQESTNYPLRASVPGFLRALLPHAHRDLMTLARHAKQTPLQYIRSHESLILESCGGEATDIFAPSTQQPPGSDPGGKRRASDPFYDGSLHTNGTHHPMDAIDYPPQPKRPHTSSILNPSPFLYPMPIHSNLFDYSHPYQPSFHTNAPEMLNSFERCRDNITVRDVSSMNSGFSEPRASLNTGTGNTLGLKNDEEWKNINTMLNCILSMVEKTKRALAILQQRGSSTEPPENNDIKRVCSEIMAATVRQTEERVAEVRRRAEDAVNQVKRQALLDLQRAVGAAETKALELVAAERSKMERLLADARKHSPPPAASRDVSPPPATSNQQNMCWNCGRKAQETCSGCNQARYCGAFCQHKDWENHHQVCCGRDLKPTTILTTSPPVSQPNKALPRSTTPISTSSTTERHPIAPERLGVTPERLGIGPERLGVGPERLGVGPERLGVAAERLSVAAERLGVVPERHITDRHQLSSERLPVSENRLSLNNAERMPSVAQSANERITLAALSTAQGLIGGIGGKK